MVTGGQEGGINWEIRADIDTLLHTNVSLIRTCYKAGTPLNSMYFGGVQMNFHSL